MSLSHISVLLLQPLSIKKSSTGTAHPSRIPDLGSRIQKQQWKTLVKKKIVVILFFLSHKFHKIKLFYFWNVEEKNLGKFSKNYSIELFTQKIVSKLSKIWVWDPGSEIRDSRVGIRKKPIPDPGSRGQKGTGSRIRILNTVENYCQWLLFLIFSSVVYEPMLRIRVPVLPL